MSRFARRCALGALIVVVAVAAACSGFRGSAKGSVIGRGTASWYGEKFHGRSTANGERYDMHGLTAAHKTLPFGTVVEVRNLDNGRSVRVRINDRGPFVRGRIIDLSYAAARRVEMIGPGTARVELVLVRPGNGSGGAPGGEPATTERTRPEEPLPARPGATNDPTAGGTRPIEPIQPAPRTDQGDDLDDRWTVQVGAFREPRRARDLRDLLSRHFPETEVRSAGGWHRVQIGRFEKQRKARRLRNTLRDLGWDALVVPLR